MDVLQTVSNRLYELRVESGETLAKVAEGANTFVNNVSRYEKGERLPALDILVNLANYYNVSMDYLSGRSNSRNTLDNLPPCYAKLNDTEQTLLSRFRRLNPEGQELVLARALECLVLLPAKEKDSASAC